MTSCKFYVKYTDCNKASVHRDFAITHEDAFSLMSKQMKTSGSSYKIPYSSVKTTVILRTKFSKGG